MYVKCRLFLIGMLLLTLSACSGQPKLKALATSDVIVAYGDSLTYGTGVSPTQSYPAVLQALINRKVINSGVPGETTEEALNRLPSVLAQYHPKLVILCTGGNDMLRRLNINDAQSRIRQMIKLIQAQDAQVVLLGVPTLTLLGGSAEFYKTIADDLALPYEGKILNKIEKDRTLKSDTIHPNEQGYEMMAQSVVDILKEAGAVK